MAVSELSDAHPCAISDELQADHRHDSQPRSLAACGLPSRADETAITLVYTARHRPAWLPRKGESCSKANICVTVRCLSLGVARFVSYISILFLFSFPVSVVECKSSITRAWTGRPSKSIIRPRGRAHLYFDLTSRLLRFTMPPNDQQEQEALHGQAHVRHLRSSKGS